MSRFNTGLLRETGRGCAQSFEEAAEWYRQAAEEGHAEAAYNLGVLFENGDGVPESRAKAEDYYTRVGGSVGGWVACTHACARM